MGLAGKTSTDEARALNRFSFIVLQPALIFALLADQDFGTFDVLALSLYAASEIVVFLASYVIARFVFRRAHLEAFLLGMAMIFVNSVLYILPISFLIYGEAAALPIAAVVAWDASISFAFFIISMELMSPQSLGNPLKRIVQNPVLLAIVVAVTVNLSGIAVPIPMKTFADFAGVAAAPLTLFAVGVILSQSSLKPSGTVLAFSAIKLFAFPLCVWLLLSGVTPDNAWTPLLILTAAGPSGAMAFSLALLYNVRTDAIAQVIIWTSVLSLFSLAYLA